MSETLRGVNLGGWLVLEKWITPELFKGTDARDEYSLVKTSLGRKRIEKHRKTFMKEADFEWLAGNGINAVRIPVGYWLLRGDDPYISGIKYLDWAVDMAEKYQLKVLINLHGARGSQNGHNHSGRLHIKEWHKRADYRRDTIDILEDIVIRYRTRECVWGVELLNEPGAGLLQLKVRAFYRRAYRRLIRVARPGLMIVFSDIFRPRVTSGAIVAKTTHPVAMDVHWYQFAYRRSLTSCLRMIRRRGKVIHRLQRRQPVIVGEWSGVLSTKILAPMNKDDRRRVMKLHIEEQLTAYDNAAGWFYWTYKTNGPGMWNFRSLVEEGVISH